MIITHIIDTVVIDLAADLLVSIEHVEDVPAAHQNESWDQIKGNYAKRVRQDLSHDREQEWKSHVVPPTGHDGPPLTFVAS